jgi:hypothetical protein
MCSGSDEIAILTMAGLDPAIQRLDGRLKAAHGE